MKIGILGGTFSPVHNGHIEIAKLAKNTIKLDKVLFVPNRVPPHRKMPDIKLNDKINLIKLAIKPFPEFELEEYEVNKEEVSYLYKTLIYLSEKYKDDKLYFLCGADNINEISGWKRPDLIFGYADIVFIKRPNFTLDDLAINNLKNKYNGSISVIDYPGVDVSSTKIRNATENFLSIKNYVPKDVMDYIFLNTVYPVNVIEKLKGMLKESRFIHSLDVAKEAYKLAKCYNEDYEKAYYTGLLHDCAKNMPLSEQISLIEKYGEYEIMEDELSFPKVVHALCGPVVAKREFNVNDKKILDGIRFHTLGNINMTLFDKIIYIADLICVGREYKGVEILRKLAYNNIDKAIVTSIDNTLNYLNGEKVQKDVIKLRDFLKEKIK